MKIIIIITNIAIFMGIILLRTPSNTQYNENNYHNNKHSYFYGYYRHKNTRNSQDYAYYK